MKLHHWFGNVPILKRSMHIGTGSTFCIIAVKKPVCRRYLFTWVIVTIFCCQSNHKPIILVSDDTVQDCQLCMTTPNDCVYKIHTQMDNEGMCKKLDWDKHSNSGISTDPVQRFRTRFPPWPGSFSCWWCSPHLKSAPYICATNGRNPLILSGQFCMQAFKRVGWSTPGGNDLFDSSTGISSSRSIVRVMTNQWLVIADEWDWQTDKQSIHHHHRYGCWHHHTSRRPQ